MSISIKDGSSGNIAGVTEDHHLQVAGRIDDRIRAESEKGLAFNVNAGFSTLTSANESALLYFSNPAGIGGNDIDIDLIVYNTKTSTGGAGEGEWRMDKNPTGGTIISDAVAVNVSNWNTGAQDFTTSAAVAYSGGEGKTATGGTPIPYSTLKAGDRLPLRVPLTIAPGTSIAVFGTPPAGNTSMDVSVALVGYFATLPI